MNASDTRPLQWYVDNFGRGEELRLIARQARADAAEATERAHQAEREAQVANSTTEIFEGYPLTVYGQDSTQITVRSAANRYGAVAYESAHSGQEGRWYVRLEDFRFPTYDQRKAMREGGTVFHLHAGVSREQALEEAKQWVAFQTTPAANDGV